MPRRVDAPLAEVLRRLAGPAAGWRGHAGAGARSARDASGGRWRRATLRPLQTPPAAPPRRPPSPPLWPTPQSALLLWQPARWGWALGCRVAARHPGGGAVARSRRFCLPGPC